MEPASWVNTGTQELARRNALPCLQTGNATLDQLRNDTRAAGISPLEGKCEDPVKVIMNATNRALNAARDMNDLRR